MRPKVIIWDFDGTLASSLEGIAASMHETLTLHGFSAPKREDVRSTVGLTLEESIRRLTHNSCSDEALPVLVQHYRNLHSSKAAPLTKLFDGADDVLREAQRRGIDSILVSNKGRSGLQQLLNQFDIEDMFRFTFSAEDVMHRKPDPRLFTHEIAAKLEDISPGEVLVIGDTETDLNFATASGLRSCWAKYGYGNQERCLALKPDIVIESIRGLWAALQVCLHGE